MFHGSLTQVMGTQLDVLFLSDDESQAHNIWNNITQEVLRLHQMLNRFSPESELSIINKEALYHQIEVSPSLFTILTDCLRYSEITLGYFDITLLDYSTIILGPTTSTIQFTNPETQLDLGGYAKGYALEVIRNLLINNEIENAFINFGNSSVLALGTHPHGDYWPVGVINPYNPEHVIRTFQLKNESLSSSGNSLQKEKHIINPFNRQYNTEKKIVSIVASNALDAEVLTTALYVCPRESVKSIIANFNIKEYLFEMF